MPSADVLMHPVRLRIVQTLLDGRAMTAADLRAELPDVATASLYRHLTVLLDADVVKVVAEKHIRGAIERSYQLNLAAAVVDADTARAMSPESHRRTFSVFVAMLLADFDRYLGRAGTSGIADDVSYRQAALWLTDDETAALREEVATAIVGRMANEPTEGRTRRLISTVLMPGRQPARPVTPPR